MKAMLIVWMKELRELVRDRRTLFLALVLGPLLTPVIILGLITLAENRAKGQIEKPLEIAIVGAERAPNLVAWLGGQGITRKVLDEDPDTAIRNQDEDVYLRIEPDFATHWRDGTPALVEIVHDSTREDSRIPVKRVEAAIDLYRQELGALRLLARGVSPAVASPVVASHKDLSTPEARKGLILAFLPYMLILSAFLGTMQLVVDTTAGERERQSLEPLLATPAKRGAIVSGKIAAACTVGVTTLLLTMLALKAGAQFAPGIARQISVDWMAIGKMLFILLPMVFIGDSLLTFIAAGAKSVKEAQSYTGVLILLPMIPTLILMVSPVKNQPWMFAVPFLAQNQMLLKVIRTETIEPLTWAVYLAAGFGLAAVLWFAATRRYHQEKLAVSA